jgi:hypothetical protein
MRQVVDCARRTALIFVVTVSDSRGTAPGQPPDPERLEPHVKGVAKFAGIAAPAALLMRSSSLAQSPPTSRGDFFARIRTDAHADNSGVSMGRRS